jgi:hypothetical protein
MADRPKLTPDDLLTWGRDWQRHLEQGLQTGQSYHVPRPLLDDYVAAANEALTQMIERAARKTPKRRGRPSGSGMGDRMARLVANGVHETDAIRMVAAERKTKFANVQRAYDGVRKKT